MHPITLFLSLSLFSLTSLSSSAATLREEPPEGYNKRMQWFADAQYGMFVHFGLYSTLGGEWKGVQAEWYSEWIQCTQDIPREEYAQLMDQFNPTGFDADLIVRNAKDAGMTYLVVTSKHHEGFCLWDSQHTEFDVASTPFRGRDILQELSDACKKHGLKFGLYYSIIDWNHLSQEPTPGKKGFDRWGENQIRPEMKADYVTYMTNQILELMKKHDPALLWFDADWVAWWKLEDGIQLYNTIREADAAIIVNNRVAKRGSFELDYVTQEQTHFDAAFAMHWEGCYTMNKSWGYKKHDHEWKSPETVYNKLKDINEKGGVLLLNVGPDGKGVVQDEAWQILRETAVLLKEKPIQKRVPKITKVPSIKPEATKE